MFNPKGGSLKVCCQVCWDQRKHRGQTSRPWRPQSLKSIRLEQILQENTQIHSSLRENSRVLPQLFPILVNLLCCPRESSSIKNLFLFLGLVHFTSCNRGMCVLFWFCFDYNREDEIDLLILIFISNDSTFHSRTFLKINRTLFLL